MAETATETATRTPRRSAYGVVITAQKTPKTIRVEVQYREPHAKYGKYLRRRTRLLAHDEKGEARIGDRVQVMQCRPISKRKSWRLVRVVMEGPRD